MRAMPFMTVPDKFVMWQAPRIQLNSGYYHADDVITSWDYLQPILLLGGLRFDADMILETTRIECLDVISAVIHADCAQTGARFLTSRPIYLCQAEELRIEIPPNSVAKELEVGYSLVLGQSIPESQTDVAVAHLKGSRLLTSGKAWRFRLEALDGGFPTEAFNFEKAALPAGSAWVLECTFESLHDSYLATVRLMVNDAHPVAGALLNNPRQPELSVLKLDVLQQLFTITAQRYHDQVHDTFEVGSVGDVLDDLSDSYLHQSLNDTINLIDHHPGLFRARLQEATRFLLEDLKK